MTSFDLRVQQLLQSSTISAADKVTIMQNTLKGLEGYRHMTSKETPTDQPLRLDPKFVIQYSLADTYQRDVRKLQQDIRNGVDTRAASMELSPTGGHLGGFTFGDSGNLGVTSAIVEEEEDDDDVAARNRVTVVDDDSDMLRRATAGKSNRKAICAEGIRADEITNFVPNVVHKSEDAVAFLTATLSAHSFFQHLEESEMATVVACQQVHRLFPNDTLFSKGDEMAMMYVVCKGTLRGGQTEYKKGDTILDNCLMYTQTAREGVVATTDAEVYSLTQKDYKLITAKCSQARREQYSGFLSKVKFLAALTTSERLQLADGLRGQKYNKGDYLIRYGEEGKWFCLILEGVVEVVGRDKSGAKVPVCTFTTGDCVGELEFLYQHKTVADCIAQTPVVRVAQMTRRHFEKLMGPAKEVLERNANTSDVYKYYRSARSQVFGE
jgi:CRP-like cAMP-binding protein